MQKQQGFQENYRNNKKNPHAKTSMELKGHLRSPQDPVANYHGVVEGVFCKNKQNKSGKTVVEFTFYKYNESNHRVKWKCCGSQAMVHPDPRNDPANGTELSASQLPYQTATPNSNTKPTNSMKTTTIDKRLDYVH
jgi:hypothetical protein